MDLFNYYYRARNLKTVRNIILFAEPVDVYVENTKRLFIANQMCYLDLRDDCEWI